jgi:chemotaxis family two-component system sensor kinase Cph1
MKKDHDKPAGAAELRRRAESRFKENQTSRRSEVGDRSTAEETQRLVHELEVHQIQLEMQNEELLQARAEVEAILGQYTDLYDFAPVGYFTLGRDGTIRQVNLTGARLLGVDRSGLASRRFGLLVSADSRPAFNAFLKKVFESQAKETCELALRKEGQEPLWARIDATATQDSQACRAAVVDITERKRAEAEVQAAQEKLSVEQRRGQRRLKKVIRELERRNRDLQDFVHAASHDLRAPLVNICGFGDLLGSACQRARTAVAGAQDGESLRAGLRPLLDEEIPESLGYIRTSSSKMDALLTGLLNVSRIGSAALTIEQLDLNEMVAGIVRSTEFSVEQAGATVEVDALPPCRGDANQLGQVFSNLLDNALKYLDPTRPGVIRVSGRRKQKEVVYCVEDNGIGIDAGHQDAIFGLFHRLNPDRGSGLGLGLTIARRSLDRQGGKIWLESTPSQGSKFFFSLPSAQLSGSAPSKLHRPSETEVRR